MTWLEFMRKVKEVTSGITSDEVPITFLHGDREISPDDITVCCEETGGKLALTIVLLQYSGECDILSHVK